MDRNRADPAFDVGNDAANTEPVRLDGDAEGSGLVGRNDRVGRDRALAHR